MKVNHKAKIRYNESKERSIKRTISLIEKHHASYLHFYVPINWQVPLKKEINNENQS